MIPGPDDIDDDLSSMVTCEWCEGHFLPEDMQGEHCRDCASEIFEDLA